MIDFIMMIIEYNQVYEYIIHGCLNHIMASNENSHITI